MLALFDFAAGLVYLVKNVGKSMSGYEKFINNLPVRRTVVLFSVFLLLWFARSIMSDLC